MDTEKMMKVESVTEDSQRITVVTTGAKYIIDKLTGGIECWQMLGRSRLLAKVVPDCTFSEAGFSVDHWDENLCAVRYMFSGTDKYIRIQINKDSLMEIYSMKRNAVKINGFFMPKYQSQKNGNALLIDETGGMGIYPYKGLRNMEMYTRERDGMDINYEMDSFSRLFVSVFPPRKFNYKQYFEDRIYHRSSVTGDGKLALYPVPSDEELDYVRRFANILVLHETVWKGSRLARGLEIKTRKELYEDAAWCCYDYKPFNEKELERTIKKAHSLGMRVITYMSPFYSSAKGEEYLDRVRYTIDTYGVDGIYFDGNSMDILESYQRVRDVRKILKDRLLYIHCSSDPMSSHNIYCPFIDTYADYILRAEWVKSFSEHYLRYVISGFNISNTIGHICFTGYTDNFLRNLVKHSYPDYVKLFLSSLDGKLDDIVKNEYFPGLDKAYNKYLSDCQVPIERRAVEKD